jgi:hypothetical protein
MHLFPSCVNIRKNQVNCRPTVRFFATSKIKRDTPTGRRSSTDLRFPFAHRMASERKIRRYASYFQGWATAFGSHEKYFDEGRGLSWLIGEDQIGLILTPVVKDFLNPLFCTWREEGPPRIELGPEILRIADATISLGEANRREIDVVVGLLKGAGDLHLLQTYHLVYPPGTRILTLTRQTPLTLVYREIEPLTLRFI